MTDFTRKNIVFILHKIFIFSLIGVTGSPLFDGTLNHNSRITMTLTSPENLNVQNAFSILFWVRPSRDDVRLTILDITTEISDVKSSLKISSDDIKIYVDIGKL